METNSVRAPIMIYLYFEGIIKSVFFHGHEMNHLLTLSIKKLQYSTHVSVSVHMNSY